MCHTRELRTPCVPFQLELLTQGGIPAGSMNLTPSTDLQEEGQEGLITP